MSFLLLSMRVFLGGVFGVAGISKLVSRSAFRETLHNFGAPVGLAGVLSIVVPMAELVVAVALLPVSSASWGALAAVLLLATFTAAITFNLAKGRRPNCRCFGQLHSTPIGVPTLLRNVALGALAGLIVYHHTNTPSLLTWIGGLSPTSAILFAIVLVEGLILFALLRQQGRMLRRLDIVERQFARGGVVRGLAVGTPAPGFTLPNLEGKTITLDTLRGRGLPIVLVFTDPDCSACRGLAARIAIWQRDYKDKLMLVSVSRGAPDRNRAEIGRCQVGQVLLQKDHEVDDAYQIEGTPMAVLVRPDGTIGSPQSGGGEGVESLVAGVVGELGSSPLLTATATKGNGDARASGLAA